VGPESSPDHGIWDRLSSDRISDSAADPSCCVGDSGSAE
jgi:hypothetical protein